MEFRNLTNDEIERLVQPILKEQGWAQLNINEEFPTCIVKGALDDGQLIGFLVLQLFPVLGPAYVKPGYRDGMTTFGLLADMAKELKEARGYLVICDSEVSEKMCQKHRMKKIESPVYVKE
jgi:hypothetical protein